jgi:hypothetical protein
MEHTRASICHGQKEWLLVLQGESLILEFGAIDGLATSAISSCEITTL